MSNGLTCSIEVHDNPAKKRIVLVFQGGGALGAFQAGVYEALQQTNYEPSWIAGTSIGAINASIIAGNKPENRLSRLKEFWQAVSQPDFFNFGFDMPDEIRKTVNEMQMLPIFLLGIPVFFKPRVGLDTMYNMMTGNFNSFYDTSPLRDFLKELIDFKYLNKGEVRLSLGATNINTGKIRYFDSKFEKIGPEHIMASGALPPGFPPIEVEGEHYWDGGLYSNTPLSIVLDDLPRVDSLCFMVDLWNPGGHLPGSMDEVKHRQMNIAYSSRSDEHRKEYEDKHNLRRAIRALYDQLTWEQQEIPENMELVSLGCVTSMDIVQLQYRPKAWESSTKDADFTEYSIRERWRQGKEQTLKIVEANKFNKPHPKHIGVVIHTEDS